MPSRWTRSSQRGSALITVMTLMTVLLIASVGVLYLASQQRLRAIYTSKAVTRSYCVDTGLQLSRLYYGRNYANWNSYLSQPNYYDPVAEPWNSPGCVTTTQASCLGAGGCCGISNPRDFTSATSAYINHPELFVDLDGDGSPDVYLYIRDNLDELPPATPNWSRDNDQKVIVGAVCISTTIAPLLQDGQVDTANLVAESLLLYNGNGAGYAQRCGQSGSMGNCNAN